MSLLKQQMIRFLELLHTRAPLGCRLLILHWLVHNGSYLEGDLDGVAPTPLPP
jgi:hypothetical protein